MYEAFVEVWVEEQCCGALNAFPLTFLDRFLLFPLLTEGYRLTWYRAHDSMSSFRRVQHKPNRGVHSCAR